MGEDGLQTMIQIIDGLKVMTQLINNKGFIEVIMIPLNKMSKSAKSSDRTISFIAHTVSIIVRILRRKTEKKTEDVLGEDQCGLKKKKLQMQLRCCE